MCLPLVFNLLSLTQVSESLVRHAVHGNGGPTGMCVLCVHNQFVELSSSCGWYFASFVGVSALLLVHI